MRRTKTEEMTRQHRVPTKGCRRTNLATSSRLARMKKHVSAITLLQRVLRPRAGWQRALLLPRPLLIRPRARLRRPQVQVRLQVKVRANVSNPQAKVRWPRPRAWLQNPKAIKSMCTTPSSRRSPHQPCDLMAVLNGFEKASERICRMLTLRCRQ